MNNNSFILNLRDHLQKNHILQSIHSPPKKEYNTAASICKNNSGSIDHLSLTDSLAIKKTVSTSAHFHFKDAYVDLSLRGALHATEKIVDLCETSASNGAQMPTKASLENVKRQAMNQAIANGHTVAQQNWNLLSSNATKGARIYERNNNISWPQVNNNSGNDNNDSSDNININRSNFFAELLGENDYLSEDFERENSPAVSISNPKGREKSGLQIDKNAKARNKSSNSSSSNSSVCEGSSTSKFSVKDITNQEWVDMIKRVRGSPYYYSSILPTITSSIYFQPDITPQSIDRSIAQFEEECMDQINYYNSGSSSITNNGCSVKSLNMPLTFFTENILKTCISNAHMQLLELLRVDGERLASQTAAYEAITMTADQLSEIKETQLIKSKALLDKQLHFRHVLEEARQKVRDEQLVKDGEKKQKLEKYLEQTEIERREKEANKTTKLGNRKANKARIEAEKIQNLETSMLEKDRIARGRLASRQKDRDDEITIKAEERNIIIANHQEHSQGIDQSMRSRSKADIDKKELRYEMSKAQHDLNLQNSKLHEKEKKMMRELEAETRRKIRMIRFEADSKQLEIKHDKLKTVHFQQVLTESEKKQELRNLQADFVKSKGDKPMDESPGPGWYFTNGIVSPSTGGGKISKSSSFGAFDNLKTTPGPGEYNPDVLPSSRGAIQFTGKGKTDVDWLIYFAKLVPGPGYYNVDKLPSGGGLGSSSRLSTSHDAANLRNSDSLSVNSSLSNMSGSLGSLASLPFSPNRPKSTCASPKFNSRGKTNVDNLIFAASSLPGPGDYEIPIDARYRSNKNLPVLHSLSPDTVKRVMTPSNSRTNSRTNSHALAAGFGE